MSRRAILSVVATVGALLLASAAQAWTWPADGAVLRPFSFGDNPYAGGQHRGIDVGGDVGTAVRAAVGGTVAFAGGVPSGGRAVTIETGDGYSVTHLQLGELLVTRGTIVDEGAVVGTIGESQDSVTTAPHVHLGVRITAEEQGYVDPLGLLPAREAPIVLPPDPVPAPVPAPEPPSAPEIPAEEVEAFDPGSVEPEPPAVTAEAPIGEPASVEAPPADSVPSESESEVAVPVQSPAEPAGQSESAESPAESSPAVAVGPGTPSETAGAAEIDSGAAGEAPSDARSSVPQPVAGASDPVSEPVTAPVQSTPVVVATAEEPAISSLKQAARRAAGVALGVSPSVGRNAIAPFTTASPTDAVRIRQLDVTILPNALTALLGGSGSAARPAPGVRAAVTAPTHPLRSRGEGQTPISSWKAAAADVRVVDRASKGERRHAAGPVADVENATLADRVGSIAAFLAAMLLVPLAGLAMFGRRRQVGSENPARIMAASEHEIAEGGADPGRAGLAVREWPASHRPHRRLRRTVRHLRPLPPSQRQPRADGERDGRARDARDGRRRSRRSVDTGAR